MAAWSRLPDSFGMPIPSGRPNVPVGCPFVPGAAANTMSSLATLLWPGVFHTESEPGAAESTIAALPELN